MGELLEMIGKIGTIDDLNTVLSRLSDNVKLWRSEGVTDPRAYQDAAACLDRIRLVLRGMERRELRSAGASREMAERYVEAEYGIRAVDDAMRESLRPRSR